MAMAATDWSNGSTAPAGTGFRVCLGPEAPGTVADFLTRVGFDVVALGQRHHARLYVDFVGARPSGIEVLSIDLGARSGYSPRTSADFACEDPLAAACFIVSHALRLSPPLVTADKDMLSVIRSAVAVASSHVPVILTGEVGVGKQSLARLIHVAGRSGGGWIPARCSSFENADIGIPGQMPAEHGANGATAPAATVFLDELGELSPHGQTKLLELLQFAEPRPGRGEQSRPSLRIVAATNRSLAAMVAQERFRTDLFWRLNVFVLEVPPLRQRPGDVALLARMFLLRANPRRRFTASALKLLGNYTFPGNVLELESVISRLAIAPLMIGNSVIDVGDVRSHLMVGVNPEQVQTSGWHRVREGARREMIIAAIAAAGGDRAEAARRLGITTRALQYHITKAGLSKRRRRRAKALASIGEMFSSRAGAPEPQI